MLVKFAAFMLPGAKVVDAAEFQQWAANDDFAWRHKEDAEALQLFEEDKLQGGSEMRELWTDRCKGLAPLVLTLSARVFQGKKRAAYCEALSEVISARAASQDGARAARDTVLRIDDVADREQLRKLLPTELFNLLDGGVVEIQGEVGEADLAWVDRVQALRSGELDKNWITFKAAAQRADEAVDQMSSDLAGAARRELEGLSMFLSPDVARQVSAVFDEVLGQVPGAGRSETVSDEQRAKAEAELRRWLAAAVKGNSLIDGDGVAAEWRFVCLRHRLPQGLQLPDWAILSTLAEDVPATREQIRDVKRRMMNDAEDMLRAWFKRFDGKSVRPDHQAATAEWRNAWQTYISADSAPSRLPAWAEEFITGAPPVASAPATVPSSAYASWESVRPEVLAWCRQEAAKIPGLTLKMIESAWLQAVNYWKFEPSAESWGEFVQACPSSQRVA
jgi:hypothetical protein